MLVLRSRRVGVGRRRAVSVRWRRSPEGSLAVGRREVVWIMILRTAEVLLRIGLATG